MDIEFRSKGFFLKKNSRQDGRTGEFIKGGAFVSK